MNSKNAKIKKARIPSFLISFVPLWATLIGTVSFPSSASANWWAGSERSGSCTIPNRQTSFNCRYGPYRVVNGASQIGGFYVNPRERYGNNGTIPIEYRINGGGWVRRDLVLNSTSENYIDFGNGVRYFEFRFLRPESVDQRNDNSITYTFNYDLDR
ncbi:MAG TPA: hypothetical protein DDW51_07595 [Cyanobacteria bacterium UBA11367]|nr:hypothetical protein [Cyanobacteria bacterium UBA11367]